MKWLARFMKSRYYGSKFYANGLQAFELDEAIRKGDVQAVIDALAGSATVDRCTLGAENYYTPLELAKQTGNQAIIDLLERQISSKIDVGPNERKKHENA